MKKILAGFGLFLAVLNLAAAQMVNVTSAGIGIGTASPASRLHIYQPSGGSNQLTLDTGFGGGNAFALNPFITGVSNGGFEVRDVTNNIARFIVQQNTGNVGIGTTNPGYKLTVDSGSSSYAFRAHSAGDFVFALAGDGIAGNNLDLFSVRNANSGIVYVNTANNARLALGVSTGTTAGSIVENMTIVSSGNVGIGTSSPSRKLDVNGDANISTNLVVQSGIYSGHFYSLGSGIGLLNSIGGTLMSLNETGNVGIGTTSPGYKLTVSGDVRGTRFIADVNTYSDFVFKPGYRLASLAEVETAIKKDRHLPGIPSEANAKAKGIDLAEMQAKLLQKVEELTLHMIEMKKDNDNLRREVEQIKSAQR